MLKSEPLLSICIPTFNRENFLRETLNSISMQKNFEHIEIVISDNASTDNTQQMIKSFEEKFLSISLTYYRWPYNAGYDLNVLKVVECSKGKYCWLLGSDDALTQGAIDRIFEEMNRDLLDIILCNRYECDLNLKILSKRHWLKKNVKTSIFNLSKPEELNSYLENSESIGAIFSFISSIIFLREKWSIAEYDKSYTGSGYSHVYKLFCFLEKGCRLLYIDEPLVMCRGDNDSFSPTSLAKRCLLDINAYMKIVDSFFGCDPNSANEIKLLLLKETYGNQFPPLTLLKLKAFSEKKDWLKLSKYLSEFGKRDIFLEIIKIIPVNFPAFTLVCRFVYRLYKKRLKNLLFSHTER